MVQGYPSSVIFYVADLDFFSQTFTREALIWRQLNHPNILRFYGIDAKTFRESSLLGLVTPWAKNGCLDDFITKSEYNPQNHRERFVSG
jgi:serine/threonine protein kinase